MEDTTAANTDMSWTPSMFQEVYFGRDQVGIFQFPIEGRDGIIRWAVSQSKDQKPDIDKKLMWILHELDPSEVRASQNNEQ